MSDREVITRYGRRVNTPEFYHRWRDRAITLYPFTKVIGHRQGKTAHKDDKELLVVLADHNETVSWTHLGSLGNDKTFQGLKKE